MERDNRDREYNSLDDAIKAFKDEFERMKSSNNNLKYDTDIANNIVYHDFENHEYNNDEIYLTLEIIGVKSINIKVNDKIIERLRFKLGKVYLSNEKLLTVNVIKKMLVENLKI